MEISAVPTQAVRAFKATVNHQHDLIATSNHGSNIDIHTLGGEYLQTLSAHRDTITSIQFSPDGKYLATACHEHDSSVLLWSVTPDPANPISRFRRLVGHSHAVWTAAFSPSSLAIATASEDKTVKVWSVISGGLLRDFQVPEPVKWLEFSADGLKLVCLDQTQRVSIKTIGPDIDEHLLMLQGSPLDSCAA